MDARNQSKLYILYYLYISILVIKQNNIIPSLSMFVFTVFAVICLMKITGGVDIQGKHENSKMYCVVYQNFILNCS